MSKLLPMSIALAPPNRPIFHDEIFRLLSNLRTVTFPHTNGGHRIPIHSSHPAHDSPHPLLVFTFAQMLFLHVHSNYLIFGDSFELLKWTVSHPRKSPSEIENHSRRNTFSFPCGTLAFCKQLRIKILRIFLRKCSLKIFWINDILKTSIKISDLFDSVGISYMWLFSTVDFSSVTTISLRTFVFFFIHVKLDY